MTDLYSDIDVITTRTVRCRVPQELRELFVCFGRLNRILAEIGHGDFSVHSIMDKPLLLLTLDAALYLNWDNI